jgi:hypothetical protein
MTIPYFKLCYQAIVTKTAWYWHRNRHGEQRNGTGNPEISSHSYSPLILGKSAKYVFWEKIAP